MPKYFSALPTISQCSLHHSMVNSFSKFDVIILLSTLVLQFCLVTCVSLYSIFSSLQHLVQDEVLLSCHVSLASLIGNTSQPFCILYGISTFNKTFLALGSSGTETVFETILYSGIVL